MDPFEDPFADSPDEGIPPTKSRRGADPVSCNRPSRRAQIFDKGVDASMMQVCVPYVLANWCSRYVEVLAQRCLLLHMLSTLSKTEYVSLWVRVGDTQGVGVCQPFRARLSGSRND